MKRTILGTLGLFGIVVANAQNGVYAPIGVYTSTNNPATTIGTGGSALVGANGNWVFGGNVTSAGKGNSNAPNATGRGEVITFDNNGTYTGFATNVGTAGYVVDGYAASTAAWTGAVLPIGNSTTAYPLTRPAGTAVIAAYFDGSGSTQATAVTGVTGGPTTEYSPYFDVPSGLTAGSYTFGYPSGFSSTPYSALLSSGNTSASGTNGSTAYTLLANVTPFSSSASTSTAAITATAATQVYFSTSTAILPVTLTSFTAVKQGNTALLNWATATEQNNKGFDVQRSTDGTNWATIGNVASQAVNGNSSSALSYTYTDNQPLGGTDYYRLNQIDLDGRSTFSSTQTVVFGNAGAQVVVSPNPAPNAATVSGIAAGNTVRLVDMAGRIINTQIATGNTATIQLSTCPSGVYLVQVLNNGAVTTTVKVVKQ